MPSGYEVTPVPRQDASFCLLFSVGYASGNESAQGPGFIWRAWAEHDTYSGNKVLLNKQAVFQENHPAQKQATCSESDLLAMGAPNIIVITIYSDPFFTKPGKFP